MIRSLARREFGDAFYPTAFNTLVNNLLGNVFEPFQGTGSREFDVDLQEQDEKYLLRADLPGVKQDDVKLAYEDGVLTINCKQEEEKSTKQGRYLVRERSSGSFTRSFHLPNIEAEAIAAKLTNGVLEVTVPKQPDARVKRIEVKCC